MRAGCNDHLNVRLRHRRLRNGHNWPVTVRDCGCVGQVSPTPPSVGGDATSRGRKWGRIRVVIVRWYEAEEHDEIWVEVRADGLYCWPDVWKHLPDAWHGTPGRAHHAPPRAERRARFHEWWIINRKDINSG